MQFTLFVGRVAELESLGHFAHVKDFLIFVCLVGAAAIAIFLLRRVSRQRRAAYQQEREALDKRLAQQVVDGMDEETRRAYLKSHGQDVA